MAKACGAKTKAGTPCKRAPVEGKSRCKLHGGLSTGAPKGNGNAVKHGFYSDALLPDERKLYERAEVGSLDDEIRLARVKLFRYVRLAGSTDLMEMVDGVLEVIRKTGQQYDPVEKEYGPFDKKELKAAAPNYADLIIRQIDLIRKLELARADLMKDADDDAPESIVIKVRRARKDDA